MIITDVTTIKLRYEMPIPMADAIHYMPARPLLLVQVHTDEGIVGMGESAAYSGSLESMEALILNDLRHTIQGQDPFKVEKLWQMMALALAPHKINVNVIAPGIVDTPFWVEVDKQFAKLMDLPVGEPKRRAVASIPLGRIEQPDDVAAMALFLASSDADYITQQCFNVDGGNWPS